MCGLHKATMSRDSLCDILARYSDEVYGFPIGTDKNTTHCYGAFYEILLKPLRECARNVLEIGIRGGTSLCAWADYFEHAHITGLDIEDWGANVVGRERERITMLIMDATSEQTPSRVDAKEFDFILDDGSHHVEDQIAALRVWGPHLRPGGVFIIEDIFPYNVPRIRDECAPIAASLGLDFDLYDWNRLNPVVNAFQNDIVAVFSRKATL